MSAFSYQTNEIQATFDYEAIARDYTILLIEPKNRDNSADETFSFYPHPILDVLVQELKAKSSVFQRGKCLALFKKPVPDLAKRMATLSRRYPQFHIKQLYAESICSPFIRPRIFGYADRQLLMLMLASVCNYEGEESQYHNVLGQIYLPMEIREDKSNHKTCVCLHISVMAGMYLNLGVTTFRQVNPAKLPKGPLYLIARDSVRRYLGSRSMIPAETAANLFCQKGSRIKRNEITFFDLTSRAALHETKVGRFMEFLDEARGRLAPYLTVSFLEREFIRFGDVMKKPPVPESVSWNFVDLVQSPLSTLVTKVFLEYLRDQYPEYKITLCKELNPQAQTLLLFHNRRYYRDDSQGKDEEDISLPHRANLRTQGITIEALCKLFHINQKLPAMPDKDLHEKQKGWDDTLRPLLAKLYSELCIKEDIRKRCFTVFHPQDYLTEPWIYVLPKKGERQDPVHPDKTITFFHFYELVMDPGTDEIQFRYFNEASEDLSFMEIRIVEDTKAFYDSSKHGLGIRLNYKEELDGFICPGKDPDSSYMIIRTNTFLLPDYEDMPIADLEYEIPAKELFDALEQEIEQSDDDVYRAELECWYDKIIEKKIQLGRSRLSLQLLKDAFKETTPVDSSPMKKGKESSSEEKSRLRSMRGTLGTKLNEFIGRITNGHYLFTPKGKKVLLDHLMDGHLLGHACQLSRPIFYKDELEEMREGIGYVAGYNTMNSHYKVSRASIIRVILPSEKDQTVSDDMLMTYFSQLQVYYVRSGYYTVLPFPFKYLREYARYYNACQNIKLEEENDDEEDDTAY